MPWFVIRALVSLNMAIKNEMLDGGSIFEMLDGDSILDINLFYALFSFDLTHSNWDYNRIGNHEIKNRLHL